jgi:ParB family chromosome partitioning protein
MVHLGKREIRLDEIEVPEWAKREFLDPSKQEELVNSIRMRGLMQPIGVRLTPDGRYQLIYGYRRLQALRELGMAEVEAEVYDCTEEEAIVMSIEENDKRSDEHPFFTAKKIASMHEELGLSVREIAKRLGKEKSWVDMMLKINAIDGEAKRVLGPKVRDITKLYAIATINSPEKQLIAADLLVKRNLSKEETEKLARKANPMPVEEFRAYCEKLLKGEGEVQGEGAEGAEVSSRLDTSQAQGQPPAQGSRTGQGQGKAPETRECYICGEVKDREEIRFYAVCKDGHPGFQELIKRVRQYGSRNIDRVLGMVIPILDLILDYPSDKWGEIAQSIAELVPYIRGLGVERVKEVVEEVKRRHATS